MKTKKLLAMLLIMMLTVAMCGSFAGCNSADGEPDKRAESQQGEADTGKTDSGTAATATPAPTATPEPTATPTPTATPEPLPTVEELFAANEGMLGNNTRSTMEMDYTAANGVEKVKVSAKMVEEVYETITHKRQETVASMRGQSQMYLEEMYYEDDVENGVRTEYFYYVTEGKWTKSQYDYTAPEEEDTEDEDGSALKRMVNTQVTRDGDFYYLIGDMSSKDVSELTDVMSGIGLSPDFVVCEMKFNAKTKELLSVMITVKLEEGETTIDGIGMLIDKFVMTMEAITEPIVIPAEALGAEPAE